MNYIFRLCLIIFVAIFSNSTRAQKVSSEEISYAYKRLPLVAVSKNIKNYVLSFEPVYETKNQAAIKAYELALAAETDRYKREMAAYPTLLKQANDRYAKEMEEYNKKTFGKKLIEKQLLEENNKPVKILPDKPYFREIEKPVLQSSYDYGVLSSTYIKLEGYEENATNALKVQVLLYGFDYTQPRTVNVEQTRINTASSTGTSKAILYHTEFSYRHPMALKVLSPDGKELLSVTPPELNLYKTYKGAQTNRPTIVNKELLVKNLEEKILQENLTFINNLLNDKFGYSNAKRVCKLFFVKKGGDEYADLTTAFNEASSGLSMLEQDAESAKVKLGKATELWSAALLESDMKNKKARIDHDLTLAICHNLLENYFAMGKLQQGKALLNEMNNYSLSFAERKVKNEFEALFTDMKTRQSNN